jgi:hypothetical protein
LRAIQLTAKDQRRALDHLCEEPRLTSDDDTKRSIHRLETAKKSELRLKTKLLQHIAAHYAPQCLSICEQMQHELPRELRDMVYGHLLETRTHPLTPDDVARLLPENLRKGRDWGPAKKPDPSYSWIKKIGRYGLTHICDKDYVGLATMQEIAEAYYRESIFSFDIYPFGPPDPLSQHLFEATDRWGFGLDVTNLIRRLELHADVKDIMASPQKAKQDLGSLLRVEKALTISLHVKRYILNEKNLLEMATAISVLSPSLEQLLVVGNTVAVCVSSEFPDWRSDILVKRKELEHSWWLKRLQEDWTKAHPGPE